MMTPIQNRTLPSRSSISGIAARDQPQQKAAIEPKLKYRFGETYTPSDNREPAESFQSGALTDLLKFILLGPTVSTLLAKKSFVRMLELNNLNAFADRVYTSSIPLRPA